MFRILPRNKTEIFIDQNSQVTIKQEDLYLGEQLITILSEDLDAVIEALEILSHELKTGGRCE